MILSFLNFNLYNYKSVICELKLSNRLQHKDPQLLREFGDLGTMFIYTCDLSGK